MTELVIYHAGCVDGFTSAWVASRKYPDATFHPARYGDPVPDYSSFDRIFILDFSYPHDVLVQMSETAAVTVYDHHQTSITDICTAHHDYEGEADWGNGAQGLTVIYDAPYKAVLDKTRSGAGIAWDELVGGERPSLVDYVEDRDLWNFYLVNSRAITTYLRAQPQTFERWSELADMDVDELARLGQGAEEMLAGYIRSVLPYAYVCEMGGRQFPIVNVSYDGASDVCEALINKYDTDMAAYFFQRENGQWQYGFRSRGDFRVDDFAESFGGGGHRNASGCVTDGLAHSFAS